MDPQWQKIYSIEKAYRAEIVRSFLEEQGIPTVVMNKQDSSYRFGVFEVHVTQDNVLQALKLINDHITFE